MKKKTLLISLFGLSLVFSGTTAGDAKNEKVVFKKCAAFHNVASRAKHKTVPKLWNIVRTQPGVQDVYIYSNWLKGYGIEWNDETLAARIGTNKEKTAYFGKDVRKSRMISTGLEKKEQVVDLIAYLKI